MVVAARERYKLYSTIDRLQRVEQTAQLSVMNTKCNANAIKKK